jgi:hypothetical protein
MSISTFLLTKCYLNNNVFMEFDENDKKKGTLMNDLSNEELIIDDLQILGVLRFDFSNGNKTFCKTFKMEAHNDFDSNDEKPIISTKLTQLFYNKDDNEVPEFIYINNSSFATMNYYIKMFVEIFDYKGVCVDLDLDFTKKIKQGGNTMRLYFKIDDLIKKNIKLWNSEKQKEIRDFKNKMNEHGFSCKF